MSIRSTLTPTGLLAPGACSSDSGADSQDASSDSAVAAPAVAGDVVLNEADAPAGYTYSDVAEVLEEGEGDENYEDVIAVLAEISGTNTTEPARCGALLPTAVDMLTHIQQDPQASAATEFADAEGNVISVFATTGGTWERVPENLDECATFTRAATDPALHLQIVYRAEPLAIEVDGAESATAARIVSDQDVAEPAQSTYSATVDGVYFQIHTSQALDDQLLADMARAQVDKIRNR
ncbi:hypothetical protein G6030_12095 [Dietzia sp. E1]|nr:hypothetical protein [Dietzia sp. E1]